MAELEKVLKGIEICLHPGSCRECPYYRVYDTTIEKCAKEMMQDALELLKENDIELERIHQNIRTYIKGGCSTDTEADKEYVCSQIDRIFEGEPVLLDEEVEQE